MHCLYSSYPSITGIDKDASGQRWLLFNTGQRVLYSGTEAYTQNEIYSETDAHAWDVDVRTSMETVYALEPFRPETPKGYAPGRKRSYALLRALFGENKAEVSSRIVSIQTVGGTLFINTAVAHAVENANNRLARALQNNYTLEKFLAPVGGYAWRRIAGTNRLSAHSFGIALDLNAKFAPYWRWGKAPPHPAQKTYPTEIVSAFENEGFIWGGKWHEYDIMHFEYRPELICKARLLEKLQKQTP